MLKTPIHFGTLRRTLQAATLALSSLVSMAAWSQAPTVIRIGSPDLGTAGKPATGGGPLAVVHQNKYLEEEFAKDGIKVEWTFFRGAGPAVAEAIAAKQLDVFFLGDLASVIHKSRGLPTRYIVPTSRATNSFLAVAPGVQIKSFADLKGRKVAVLKGTAYQRPFDNLLAKAGLTEKDIKSINLDWPSAKAAVVAGEIDATFGGADLATLKDKGVTIPLSTAGQGAGFTIDAGVLATEDFVNQYPAIAGRVVKQIVRAAHWASQESNREALIKLLADNSGQPEAIFRQDLDNVSLKGRYSPLVDKELIADYQGVLDDGLKLNLVRQAYPVDAWFETKFVDQALRDLKLGSYWTEPAKTEKADKKPAKSVAKKDEKKV